jgi:hypothetical protein
MSLFHLHSDVAFITFINMCIQSPLRLLKMHDQKSLTHHCHSFSEWVSVCASCGSHYKGSQFVGTGQQHTKVNIVRSAAGYLNLAINRRTRWPEPGIGTDGSRQTVQNPWLMGMGLGLASKELKGLGFGPVLEPDWNVSRVQSRTAGWLPRPIANTHHSRFPLQATIK